MHTAKASFWMWDRLECKDRRRSSMNPKNITHVVLFACLVFISLCTSISAQEKSLTVSGGGGFPLTSSITSMWAAIDEPAVEGKQPLTYMLYFKGAAGWHKRKWSSLQKLDSVPAVMEFSCDLTKLHADYDRKTRVVTLFGKSYHVDSTNIILVENVDHPKNERVKGIAHLKLEPSAEENPAAWVLQKSPKAYALILGN